jgi:hypothetical protein
MMVLWMRSDTVADVQADPDPDDTDLGTTLAHDAGRWRYLFHTFEGGCGGAGDGIDTPAEQTSGSEAESRNLGRDMCPGGGKDRVRSYMD